jgi:ribonuclease HI
MMVRLVGLERMGVMVSFCWVPAHVGVEGNEKADVVVKSAVRREGIDIQVPLGRQSSP